MAILIQQIVNANIYLNGISLLGKAEELNLPDVNAIMVDHKALGMVGKINLPAGVEKLEGSIKWNSIYADVQRQVANPFATYMLMARSSVEQYTSAGRTAELAMVTYLTVQFTGNGLGSYKQHDNVEKTDKFVATYIKQVIDNQVVLELDYMANIFNVNGTDVLATYRANIGG